MWQILRIIWLSVHWFQRILGNLIVKMIYGERIFFLNEHGTIPFYYILYKTLPILFLSCQMCKIIFTYPYHLQVLLQRIFKNVFDTFVRQSSYFVCPTPLYNTMYHKTIKLCSWGEKRSSSHTPCFSIAWQCFTIITLSTSIDPSW